MRRFFLFALVMYFTSNAFLLEAQDYLNLFSEGGSVWKVKIDPMTSPDEGFYYQQYTSENAGMVEGRDAFEIKTVVERMSDRCFVSSDDMKIYALSENNEWLLIYDFSLQPGEGNTVWHYFRGLDLNDRPYMSYVVCSDIYPDETNPALSLMNVRVYESENAYRDDAESFIDEGKWLIGIGSITGPLSNIGWGDPGECSSLWQASCGEKVVYESSENSAGIGYCIDTNGLFPSNGQMQIFSKSFRLYDLNGKVVGSDLDMKTNLNLTRGVYILRSKNGDSRKIFIR